MVTCSMGCMYSHLCDCVHSDLLSERDNLIGRTLLDTIGHYWTPDRPHSMPSCLAQTLGDSVVAKQPAH